MDGHTLHQVKLYLNKGMKIRIKKIESSNKMAEEKFNDMPTKKLCKRFKRTNPET